MPLLAQDSGLTGPYAALARALADRYVLGREIGRGGMATVFLAEDLRHERQVAMKVLDPELSLSLGIERFLREIKLIARLQHPHILPLYDSGEAASLFYYVMPFISGDSLRARLLRERTLPVTDAVRITAEVSGALDYAHRQGVIHRDIKPENILLQDGHAIVADFGVARAITSSKATALTATGLAIGTAAYMSPEQAAGEREVDGRSDLYSLGCVLYEMLGGEPPFTGASAQAVIARRFVEAPPSVRRLRGTVSDSLDSIITTTLARDPGDRYMTAAQLSDALRAPEREQENGARTVRLRSRGGSTNVQAGALCDDARRLLARREVSRFAEATTRLNEASALDPHFAESRAWSAVAFVMRADLDLSAADACAAAEALACEALALDESCAAAYAARGGAHLFAWRWSDAERDLRHAASLDPSFPLPLQWLAIERCATGRLPEARQALARATAIDGTCAATHAAAGTVAYYARDFEGAVRALRTAASFDQTSPSIQVLLGLALASRGATSDARAAYERSVDLAGTFLPFTMTAMGCLLAGEGRRQDAETLQDELTALATRADISAFYRAALSAALGDKSRALEHLGTAATARDTWLMALGVHPWMDPLRQEPGFTQLITHIGVSGGGYAA